MAACAALTREMRRFDWSTFQVPACCGAKVTPLSILRQWGRPLLSSTRSAKFSSGRPKDGQGDEWVCGTSTLESNWRFSVIFNARYSRQNLFSSPSISNNKIADNIVGTYFRLLWTAKDTFIHIFRHPGKWFKAGYCQGRQFGRVAHNGLHTSRMLFCMCVMMNFTMQKV